MGRNSSSTRDSNRHRDGRGGRDGRGRGKRRPKPLKTENFKEETSEMMGAVFQCHSKQKKRGQSDETMGALKTFASTKYVSHIDYLTPIFTDLIQPTLIKPSLSNTKTQVTLKDDSKIMTDSTSTEEIEEYRIKLKEFLKDVVWGQCSHMLRTKLKGDKDFIKTEMSGDVVEF